MNAKRSSRSGRKPTEHPFRAAVLRGLAVVLPPLLTIVIFLWVGGTIEQYVLDPATSVVSNRLIWVEQHYRGNDIRRELPVETLPGDVRNRLKRLDPEEAASATIEVKGDVYRRTSVGTYVPLGYHRLPNGQAVPEHIWNRVVGDFVGETVPPGADAVYRRYVELKYLRPYVVVPFFLSVFVLLLYLLGKFMAAGVGRMFWNFFERGVLQVPLVRNVYSSVKQVSDFLLAERDLESSRVVALEWPRRGIWSLGLVTGESMRDIEAAANEPVLSVLVCTSPMPMTGFTVTVRKSETVDLDISIDQAFQFIVSCGVVVPPQQLREFRAPLKAPRPLAETDESGEAPSEDHHAVRP